MADQYFVTEAVYVTGTTFIEYLISLSGSVFLGGSKGGSGGGVARGSSPALSGILVATGRLSLFQVFFGWKYCFFFSGLVLVSAPMLH